MPIRIAYVGPNMDLAKAAYLPSHDGRNHRLEYYLRPEHVPTAPAPDVVVLPPLNTTEDQTIGPCLMSRLMPKETLIVVLFSFTGPSHAAVVRHALGERCHHRLLLHYPKPEFRVEEFVDAIDRAVRRPGRLAETMCGLPPGLEPRPVSEDLDMLLEDPNLGRCLYVAATDPYWATWADLAARVHLSEGTIKNRMSKFGKLAVEVGLMPDRNGRSFRIGEFVRFLTEHRSAVRAFAHHHPHLLEKPKAA